MKGYTLIEILVSLMIISFLFGFGYVSFRDFSRRQALAGTAKEIQGDLRLAQSQASSGQKPGTCVVNLDGYRFKVYSTSEYKLEAVCGATVSETKDVIISPDLSISLSPNPMMFKVLGQGTDLASGEDALITLTQIGTNNSVNITVSSGGEIK